MRNLGHPRTLEPTRFEGTLQGRPVRLYALTSTDGTLRAAFCNQGARLLQLIVPGRAGRCHDVVLGHDSLQQLLQGVPSMGAFIGRFANRIRNARFPHEGGTWHLPANDGPHCLHGGPQGSRHQVFEVVQHTPSELKLAWTFAQAQDGFPGDVALALRYRLEPRATLVVEYEATALGGAGVLNLTCHPFFNLEGDEHPDVGTHELMIDAAHVLVTDAHGLPTGALRAVAGTPLDFRSTRPIGEALRQGAAAGLERGFDHCYMPAPAMPSGAAALRRLARVNAPGTGVAMEVWSDAPAIQFYSGGGLDGSLPRHRGKHGRVYRAGAGLCLEPQGCPDAPNHPTLPSTALRSGEVRRGRIEYRFSVEAPSPR